MSTAASQSPAEIGARLVAALGGALVVEESGADATPDSPSASVSGGGAWARATVDVPAGRWVEAATAARDELGCDFFDWLSAVDELDEGFSVVAHVWSTTGRYGLLLRTRVPRGAPRVDSVVPVYPGAAWPERETHEMFAIEFAGHEPMKPLLLPPEFEGHPLRKEFVLAARVAKAWPGAKEPGESHESSVARRAPMRPPGVPDPAEWGPAARGGDASAADRPPRPAGGPGQRGRTEPGAERPVRRPPADAGPPPDAAAAGPPPDAADAGPPPDAAGPGDGYGD
jgi:NADH-quinone oxidoreductase subunit C